VKAAESDDAARIAASPYGVAVTITLDDIERMVGELKSDLKRGRTVAVTCCSNASTTRCAGAHRARPRRGFILGAQFAAIRSDISSVLRGEIESVPGRVRRLVRPRLLQDLARGAVLDADEVSETEAMIEFVGACSNFAGELAASEVTLRTFQEIQQYLDSSTRPLLDALRVASDQDRRFRRSQMEGRDQILR
jgi:Fe-S cluster biogenesis protein NfuA